MMRNVFFKESLLSSRHRPECRKTALLDPGLYRGDGVRFVSGGTVGVFFLLMLAFLSACGFHPRGEAARPAAAISPVFITGLPDGNRFVRELRQQLERSGVSLAPDASQAATILYLGKLDRKRSIFSVNANNKAVEYEVRRSLRFRVEHPPGNKLLNDQLLSTGYIVYNPGGELLGRTREEELRTRDAYRELARRLVTRLGKLP